MARKQGRKAAARSQPDKVRCGLCGKTGRLTRTGCCGQWICDDEDSYQLFSFARNSCSRNHRRFTLCGFHDAEEHAGRWQDCSVCREEIETEMLVYFGTNEYNFEKLANPPKFEPTFCSECDTRVVLGEGGYSRFAGKYRCMPCTDAEVQDLPAQPEERERGEGAS